MSQVILLAENVPSDLAEFFEPVETDNRQDVFRISSAGYPGAHFATFPPKLIEPMILAGTSEAGACSECGAPWRRVLTSAKGGTIGKGGWLQGTEGGLIAGMSRTPFKDTFGPSKGSDYVPGSTLAWEPGCNCRAERRPCIVLDPFMGSGTSAAVCVELRRWAWGIDLSEVYLRDNACRRIEAALRAKPHGWELAKDLPLRPYPTALAPEDGGMEF